MQNFSDLLTETEIKVARGLSRELSDQEIAEETGLRVYSVRHIVARIIMLLRCEDREQAILVLNGRSLRHWPFRNETHESIAQYE